MTSMQINTSHFYLSIVDNKRNRNLLYNKGQKQLIHGLTKVVEICEKFMFSKAGPIALKKGQVEFIELNLVLCGKDKIKSLNSTHRSKQQITDVLSFPVHDDLREATRNPLFPGPLELGDLFICREVAAKQAREFSITYEQEIYHLFIHGFLHLLGYDHERSQKEEKLMFLLEDKLVKAVYSRLKK